MKSKKNCCCCPKQPKQDRESEKHSFSELIRKRCMQRKLSELNSNGTKERFERNGQIPSKADESDHPKYQKPKTQFNAMKKHKEA